MYDLGNLGVHGELSRPSLVLMHQALQGRTQRAARLTPRQAQIARCMAHGMIHKQTGAELGISEQAVKNYVQMAYARGWTRATLTLAGVALEMAKEESR